MRHTKISVIALGCNKNQVDAEFLIGSLIQSYEVTPVLEEADVIVILPCAFLKSARREALKYIKDLSKYKSKKCKMLVVSGCYAELLKGDLNKKSKDIDLIVNIEDMAKLDSIIEDYLSGKIEPGYYDKNSKRITSVPGRMLTSSPYSYVKISDGCDNRCSYCLIPIIRGEFRSRTKKSIIQEIESLVGSGTREINLVGQDIGLYGRDIGSSLHSLLKDIVKIPNLKWLRLLYLHPRHIEAKLVDLMAGEDKICNYIDMPIQHISDKILALMNRHINKNEIISKIRLLRKKIPGIVIRTTFIVGFPKETKKEFKELLDFVESYSIDKVGVFPYSREKNTEAYDLTKQIGSSVKKERVQALLNLQKKISTDINKKYVNTVVEVLVEGKSDKGDNVYIGRTSQIAPEVDGCVYIKSNDDLCIGQFVDVKIERVTPYDMYGRKV